MLALMKMPYCLSPVVFSPWDCKLVEKTCEKSSVGNLSVESDSTFDHCIKVKWSGHVKKDLYVLYY